MRCALATLLNRSYRSVPDFWTRYRKPYRQMLAVDKWLNKKGYVMVFLDPRRKPDCLYLAEGFTLGDGGIAGHMVVMRKGKVVHDSHQAKRFKASHCWLVIPKDVGHA